jgi:endonuclease YncB( thermonuclease family)
LRRRLQVCILIVVVFILGVPPIADYVNGAFKSKSRCSVSMVMDGDTFKMSCPDDGIVTARIMGYDAPEKNARCIAEYIKATRATWALRMTLWQARTIEIRLNGKDRYDRFLVKLHVNGKDIRSAMINTGLVRAYSGGRRGSWCE